MLKKVISGMQTGADIAGLVVANGFGLETGGWCPKGFITSAGPRPDWAQKYGVKEHSSYQYPPRTHANVRDSDATLRLAFSFQTPGEKCTLKAIHSYKKPHFDVDLNNPPPVKEVISFLDKYKVETLNIAGNSETTHQGTTGEVCEYLVRVFREMGLKEKTL